MVLDESSKRQVLHSLWAAVIPLGQADELFPARA